MTLLILLMLLAGDYLLYPRLVGMGGRSWNTGENGVWLRYTWYFGEQTDAEITALAENLRQRQIRYAYMHVRYLKADGHLRYRYPREARHLVDQLHHLAPEVKVLAWCLVGAERIKPRVDMTDPVIRRQAVSEAAWLVKTCGFDGVQWDYEVCLNGDPRLLDLLRDTRAALPSTAILGVCSAPWYPAPIRRWIGWDEDYFSNVAASCDQIAVMAYDSGLFFPRGYVWFMREQTQRVPRAVAAGNPRCRVLLGVPTYEDGGGKGHSAYAENLRMALKGIRASTPPASAFAGIALFADYTTSEEEWEAYRRWWLER